MTPTSKPSSEPTVPRTTPRINNAKRSEELRLQYEEFARSRGEVVQSEPERDEIIQSLLDEPRPELDGRTLRHCIEEDEDFSFYVGGTFLNLEDEDLRWMTQRGNNKFDKEGNVVPGQDMGKKNRPVLVHPDGTNVTMKTAREEFGFRSFVVFKDLLHCNASRIEDKLQGLYQELPLGKRLWRCRGKGPKYTKDKEERVHN